MICNLLTFSVYLKVTKLYTLLQNYTIIKNDLMLNYRNTELCSGGFGTRLQRPFNNALNLGVNGSSSQHL